MKSYHATTTKRHAQAIVEAEVIEGCLDTLTKPECSPDKRAHVLCELLSYIKDAAKSPKGRTAVIALADQIIEHVFCHYSATGRAALALYMQELDGNLVGAESALDFIRTGLNSEALQ